MNRRRFKCFSVSDWKNGEDVEKGGKIIMPPSVLEGLSRSKLVTPILFKIVNRNEKRFSHCGVLEFVAGEQTVYIPKWMMRNLLLKEGDEVSMNSVNLPLATYTCLQPQSLDFLDISNPKAVLEKCLRNYACLTKGDIICIMYNERNYDLKVMETKPKEAVRIIECDLQLDFIAPPGYVEKSDAVEPVAVNEEPEGFTVFGCEGHRLNGKKRKRVETSDENAKTKKRKYARGIPDLDYKIGLLVFIRDNSVGLLPRIGSEPLSPPSSSSTETSSDGKPVVDSLFPGTGQILCNKPTKELLD